MTSAEPAPQTTLADLLRRPRNDYGSSELWRSSGWRQSCRHSVSLRLEARGAGLTAYWNVLMHVAFIIIAFLNLTVGAMLTFYCAHLPKEVNLHHVIKTANGHWLETVLGCPAVTDTEMTTASNEMINYFVHPVPVWRNLSPRPNSDD